MFILKIANQILAILEFSVKCKIEIQFVDLVRLDLKAMGSIVLRWSLWITVQVILVFQDHLVTIFMTTLNVEVVLKVLQVNE